MASEGRKDLALQKRLRRRFASAALRRLRFEVLEDRRLLSASDSLFAEPPLEPFQSGPSPAGGSSTPFGFTPTDLQDAYGFNQITFSNGTVQGNGAGETIAIVDAYNAPSITSDLIAFDAHFGLPAPPSFSVVSQTGSTTQLPSTDPVGPGGNHAWSLEEALDVEWAHALAPAANILLVEATTNAWADLFAAVNYARNQPAVNVVSMSWGGTEFSSETQYNAYLTTPAGHAGITFVVSTGDNGSPGEFPADEPTVVAVGGTSLTLNVGSNGATYVSETGWNNFTGSSGGGVSLYQSQPSFQSKVAAPYSTTKRTFPDVSFDGDPDTGVPIYDTYDLGVSTPWEQYGGTSLATPCWAALITIADQGRSIDGAGSLDGPSQTLPILYSAPYASSYHDITSGSNGQYSAVAGYDLVTGLGTPLAQVVVNELQPTGAMTVTEGGQAIGDGENSPTLTNGTDFGLVAIGGTIVTETFTITNSGSAALNLTGSPIVKVSGTNAADYTILQPTATNLPAGQSTTFQVTFQPGAIGLRQATLSIAEDDPVLGSPFTFAIQGTGATPPSIAVAWNNQPIADGESSPSGTNGTDFGVATVGFPGTTETITISNKGTQTLELLGAPLIAIGGDDAGDFTVFQPSTNSVATGGSLTFLVTFLPTAAGLRTATLSILENDPNQANPFTFAIQGTAATAPRISVSANSQSIADGENSPSTVNGTDYGFVALGGSGATQTYTITNTGTDTLDLIGTPIVLANGFDAADFTILQPTASSLEPGESTTFQVLFVPLAAGLRQAIFSIAENDTHQSNPFTFTVQGRGVIAPLIKLSSNSQAIADGEALPSTINNTDFGAGAVGGVVATETFTITNAGTSALNLIGTPLVIVTGADAADFTVTQPLLSSLAPGGTTTFEVQFLPGSAGLRSAAISIANTDPLQANPFRFAIQGTALLEPTFQLAMNGQLIDDNEASPTTENGTDFGGSLIGDEGATVVYTITNTGLATLDLTGTPLVAIAGTDPTDFLVSQPAVNSLAPDDSTTFQIQFAPTGSGLRTATLSIDENDPGQSQPFICAVQGAGVAVPYIGISGNNQLLIPNGDTSPLTTDGTDFGSALVAGASTTETFTISNTGTAALNLTGSPIVVLGGSDTSDFSITQPTASSVAPGDSATFQVTFVPTAAGLRTASISIASDDASQSQPYTFAIQGTGSAGTLTLGSGVNTSLGFVDANDFVVTVDGVATTYSTASINQVVDDAAPGDATELIFADTFNTYAATQSLDSLELVTPGFELDAAGVTTLYAYATAASTATVNVDQGTESNFYVGAANAGYSYLADPARGVYSELSGFGGQTVSGSGGSTYAYVYPAPGSSVIGDPAGSSVTTDGITMSLGNFPQLYVVGGAGGNDSITLNSQGGTFVGTPGFSYVAGKYQGAPFLVGALYFSTVTGQASTNGTDVASFYSYAGDAFNGAVGLSTLSGSTDDALGNPYNFQTQAKGYFSVTTYESGSGTDSANLTSAAGGVFTGTPTYSQLIVGTSTITVNSFIVNTSQAIVAIPSKVTAVGSGSDTANLDDATGSNALVASGKTATLTTSIDTLSVTGFKAVNAFQSSGNDDTVHQSAFDAALTLDGNWVNV